MILEIWQNLACHANCRWLIRCLGMRRRPERAILTSQKCGTMCIATHCTAWTRKHRMHWGGLSRRGENVGAWRQACYKPLVAIAARQGWDIDAIFNAHPRLGIWYVPTRLRQLCHAERNGAGAAASSSVSAGAEHSVILKPYWYAVAICLLKERIENLITELTYLINYIYVVG